MEHDNSYKLLFSHADLVADLLRGFVHEPWEAELDFGTLERFSSSPVSDSLQDRHDDLIWRVRWRGRDWLYISICCWNSNPPAIPIWRCGCWPISCCCIRN